MRSEGYCGWVSLCVCICQSVVGSVCVCVLGMDVCVCAQTHFSNVYLCQIDAAYLTGNADQMIVIISP